jgi:hypothetical protein
MNYFGGIGKLQYIDPLNGHSALYDEEYKYFDVFGDIYLKMDKNNELMVNCDNASCPHTDISCKAYVERGEYFVFHDKLYKCYHEIGKEDGEIIEEGYIVDCENEDQIVFDNPIPEEVDEDLKVDDSTEIDYLRVLSDEIIKVQGRRHVYLLDKNFNIIYWHDEIGDFPWGTVYDNKYYYVNDLFQMVCVDLTTFEKSIIETEGKVVQGEYEGDFLFYSNQARELYKYSLKDSTSEKVFDNVSLFSVHDDKIYCYYTDRKSNMDKVIIDTKGNFIFDATQYENMVFDCLVKLGNKIYCPIDDGIAEMNLDGSGYKEYYLE